MSSGSWLGPSVRKVSLAASLLGMAWGSSSQPTRGQETAATAPVVRTIVQVEAHPSKTEPDTLIVTGVGEVRTGGYRNVHLERVRYTMPPADGIQEYNLRATPPDGPATQVISEVRASDSWAGYRSEAPWLKGVRVYGEGRGMTKLLPTR